MRELNLEEIEVVNGGGPLAGVAYASGALAVGAGFAAMVPSPASIPLGFVSGFMWLTSATLGYMDSQFSSPIHTSHN